MSNNNNKQEIQRKYKMEPYETQYADENREANASKSLIRIMSANGKRNRNSQNEKNKKNETKSWIHIYVCVGKYIVLKILRITHMPQTLTFFPILQPFILIFLSLSSSLFLFSHSHLIVSVHRIRCCFV